MPIPIEFEGLGENLTRTVREARDGVESLRVSVEKTNAAIREGASGNVRAAEQFNEVIEATTQSIQTSNTAVKNQAASTNANTKAVERNTKAVSGQSGAVKGLNADLNRTKPAADKATQAIKTMGTTAQQAGAKASFLGRIGGALNSIKQGATSALGSIKGVFSSIGTGLTSAIPEASALTGVLSGLAAPLTVAGAAAAGLVANLTRLDSVATFVDGLKIQFDFIGDRLTSFEGITSLFDSGALANDYFEAQALANEMDRIADIQLEINLANAKANVQITALNQKLRDTTKTEEERLAVADEIAAIERKRAQEEIQLLSEKVKLQVSFSRAELARLGEISDEQKASLNEAQVALLNAQAESLQLTESTERRRNLVLEEGAEERKRITEKETARRKQLNEQLLKLDEDLAKKVAAIDVENADPFDKLALQKQAAIEEVRILEQKIREANAALGRGNQLTLEQETQLADLRLGIQVKYEKEVAALREANAKERVQLIVDAGERERAAFDIDLKSRVEALRKAGAEEVEVERFIQQQRDQFRVGQVQKAIDLEEQIALARIDAIERGAESEAAFRLRIENLKLDAQEAAAKQRLDAIKDDTTQEAELLRAQLEAIIVGINAKRAELVASAPKFDLFSLLGINVTEEQKQQLLSDLATIGQAVQEAALANIAAQQAQVQGQIEATDMIVEDQRRRRDELQNLLDQALEDQRAGYANNSDAIREQIALTQSAEDQALENRKRLLEEQRRLAKQQAIIESASQVSSLATAAANLLARESVKGIPGVIAGLAFALTLVSTFASIRARIKAANAEVPQFFKGTDYVDREGRYPAGRDRVPAMLNRGEAVIPTASNAKHHELVKGLVENDSAKIQQAAIKHLLESANIQLDREVITKVVHTKEKVIHRERVERTETFEALRKDVKGLKKELRAFREQEGGKPQSVNGRVTKGSTTKKKL